MPTDPGCPDVHRLEQLILGHLHGEQVEPLEEHVAGCDVCADALANLPAIDPLVEAVRSARQQEETCPDLVRALIRGLKREHSHYTTITGHGEGPAPLLETFDFLDPPRDVDELGRLGPYRVLRLLGAGGMGMVFLAEDPRLKRQIALKVIKPDLLPRDDMRERFLQEARTVAAVEHENIVAIHEVEEHRGVPYLAMPLLRGESLDDRLRSKKGPMPLEETLEIARQIAAGLAAAHAKGLIHRDVKPGNIFLAGERVKVLDFGLARDLSQDEEGGAQLGVLVGTPAYMAPEQAAGQPVDGRADLFSFGCVLYRMATGRSAFDGMDLYTTLIRIATEEPALPDQLNPALPAEMTRLILRLLAKKPEDRPATADEVVQTLTKIDEERRGRQGSRRWWLATAGAGVLTALGMGVWVAAARHRGETPKQEFEEAKTRIPFAGKEIRQTYLRPIATLTASPRLGDRLVVVACRDYGVGIWDAARDDKPSFFEGHKVPVLAVAVAPDGRHVASGGGKKGSGENLEILVWDLATRKPLTVLPGHDNHVLALAFAADGRLASGDDQGEGYFWDLNTKKKIPFTGHDREAIHALAFTPDGTRLLTAGGDNVVGVWDAATGKLLRELKGHAAAVLRVAVSGQQALSTAEDGSVWLWDLVTYQGRVLFEPGRGVIRVVFLGSGESVLWGDKDGSIGVWDLAAEKEAYRFAAHKGAVNGVLSIAEGRQAVSYGQDGWVRLWELPQ